MARRWKEKNVNSTPATNPLKGTWLSKDLNTLYPASFFWQRGQVPAVVWQQVLLFAPHASCPQGQ
jgi:hypothetical protein